MFYDRREAALMLAQRLTSYRGHHPLVLGIPRGAVPMAKTIAQQLDGDYDVVLVRKLRSPNQPEFAIGAIDENGVTHITNYAKFTGASNAYIEAEKNINLKLLRKDEKSIRPYDKWLSRMVASSL